MCACNFDMQFTFMYSGWEGNANDSRAFEHAIMSQEMVFPWPFEGWDLYLMIYIFVYTTKIQYLYQSKINVIVHASCYPN